MTRIDTHTDLPALEAQLFTHNEQLGQKELKQLAHSWAHAIAEETGKDYGKVDLAAALAPHVEKINEQCPPAHAKLILNTLSEAVEAQFKLAEHLHNAVQQNRFKGDSLQLFADASYPESAWITIGAAMVTFLKQAISDDSIAAFTASQPQFPAEKAKQFYQEYWALSNAQQAEFLGKVFAAPDRKRGPDHRAFMGKMKDLLDNGLRDEFLPPDDPARGEDSAYQIGSKIFKAVTMAPPEPKLMTRMLASLMDALHDDAVDQASAKPRTTDVNARFGYRLGRFMNNLGPGAAKTAQFGHSLPVTPEAWAEGLAGSKSNAANPSRYEYLQWVKESVSEDVQKHITHIGSHKGTGSYLSTYGVELDSSYIADSANYERYRNRHAEKDLVLSVKKPNAKEDALEFVDYLLELGEKIKSFSPAAGKSLAPLMELMEQGKGMVEKETDLNYSARQETLASQIYDQLKIISASHTMDYYTQGAFDYGDNFRVSLCVNGKHFNELPEETASQKAIKRRVAVMLFASELYVMLSGRPFDHDRHGDNQGVEITDDKISVGNFDTGALALEPPTPAQKKMFADCLVNALSNSVRNKYGVLSSLKHTIAKTSSGLGEDQKNDLDYINSVLRATMSLGDYMHYMKPNDYKQAFLAVAETGDIDPLILSRLSQRLGAIGLNKGSDYVASIPLLGPMANGIAALAGAVGLGQWSRAQERDQEATYYSDSRNPAWKPREKRQPATHAQQVSDEEKPEKIKMQIESPPNSEKPGFANRVLSLGARWAK